jgi:hypothetical protein
MADALEKNEEGELEFISSEDEFNEEDFEETGGSVLSLKQKIFLIGICFFSILSFVIFLFPVEEIARYGISKFSESSGIVVDFKNLKLPLLGNKTVDSFYFQTKDGMEIKSEEIILNVGLLKLYQEAEFKGEIEFSTFEIDSSKFTIKAGTLNIISNLTNLDKELASISGTVGIHGGNGMLVRLPELPIIGNLSGTPIKMLDLDIQKNGPRVEFKKASINLSIARIKIKGKLELSPVFNASRLDIEVCPELSKEFATEREDLANMLISLKKGDETCIPVSGTISDPKVNINFNSAPSPTPSTEVEKGIESLPKQ